MWRSMDFGAHCVSKMIMNRIKENNELGIGIKMIELREDELRCRKLGLILF